MGRPPGSFIVGLSLSYFYLLKEKEHPEDEGDDWSPIYIALITEEGRYKQKIIPVSSLRSKSLDQIVLDDYQLKRFVNNSLSTVSLTNKDEVFHVDVIGHTMSTYGNYEITEGKEIDKLLSTLQQELRMKEEMIANLEIENDNTECELMSLNSRMEIERHSFGHRTKCLEALYSLVSSGQHSSYISWEDYQIAEKLFQYSDQLLLIYDEYLKTRDETSFLIRAKTILRSTGTNVYMR